MTAPTELGVVHLHLHTRARCNGSPAVQALVVKRCDKVTKPFWPHFDTASNAHWQRHIDFIDVDGECLSIPVQTAGANVEMLRTARNMRAASLCHGPSFTAFAIQRHIQRAMVFWIGKAASAAACQCIVGRKNTAYKGNDGEAVLAVVAERVDIPPEITTRRDDLVKPRSAISVAAAKRPDMAAIGTPGPGCTLPPAV